jgi:ribosomal protein L25 (general stress protein Ctc)
MMLFARKLLSLSVRLPNQGVARSMTSVGAGVISPELEAIINPPAPSKGNDIRQIKAVVRTVHKTRLCQKLRDGGRVPGVLHGKNEAGKISSTILHVGMKELQKEIRELGLCLENTPFELELTDEATGNVSKHIVTPRQLTLNPLNETPTNVNWLKFEPGCRMRIPIKYINEDACQDLKRGCFLLRVNQFVECICHDIASMPKFITVDLASAKKGSVLSITHMTFPDKVRPSSRVPQGFVAAVIKNK